VDLGKAVITGFDKPEISEIISINHRLMPTWNAGSFLNIWILGFHLHIWKLV